MFELIKRLSLMLVLRASIYLSIKADDFLIFLLGSNGVIYRYFTILPYQARHFSLLHGLVVAYFIFTLIVMLVLHEWLRICV